MPSFFVQSAAEPREHHTGPTGQQVTSQSSEENDETPPESLRWRHAAFVTAVGAVAAAVCLGAPLAVHNTLVRCKGVECLSLEGDLERSMDPTANPCHDFYQHVCGRWSHIDQAYDTPRKKYDAVHQAEFLRKLMFQDDTESVIHFHRKHRASKIKMAKMLVKCRSQTDRAESLRGLLDELKLPFPASSPSSELEILDLMVGSSLEYGLPLMWAFTIGRHPRKTRQNAVYLVLDSTVELWFRQVRALAAKRNVAHFLRRCAERLGGTGQSYDRMLRGLLGTHLKIEGTMNHSVKFSRPQLMNYSEVTLRLAINRHLPDESQQWPEDELVCMQRDLFNDFRKRYLASEENATSFKTYVGAYVVWYLAPYTSEYITRSLMVDLGTPQNLADFIRSRCSELVENALPLAFWKTQLDRIDVASRRTVFEAYSLLREVLLATVARHDAVVSQHMSDFIETLSLNFYNMSLEWDVLERIYEKMPHIHGTLVNMYSALQEYNMRNMRASMRKPSSTFVHVPYLVSARAYSILAAREIPVPLADMIWPMLHSRYPLAVQMAGFGWELARGLVDMIYYTYFLDSNLNAVPAEKNDFPASLKASMGAFEEELSRAIRRSGISLSDAEVEATSMDGFALFIAHRASKGAPPPRKTPEESRKPAGMGFLHNDNPTFGHDVNSSHGFFGDIPAEKLFLLLSCFHQCSKRPGPRELIMCNQLVPRLPGFAPTFGCKAGDRLFLGTPGIMEQRSAPVLNYGNGSRATL